MCVVCKCVCLCGLCVYVCGLCVFVQADEGDSECEDEVAQLEQQIDICNTQITDLQQKLIDADQGTDCLSVSLSVSVCLSASLSLCLSACQCVCLLTV